MLTEDEVDGISSKTGNYYKKLINIHCPNVNPVVGVKHLGFQMMRKKTQEQPTVVVTSAYCENGDLQDDILKRKQEEKKMTED